MFHKKHQSTTLIFFINKLRKRNMTNTTSQKNKKQQATPKSKNIRLIQKQTKKYNTHIFDKTNYPPEKKYTQISAVQKKR